MDAKTAQMVREWVARDGGNAERTARWMSRTLRVGGLRACRQMVAVALAAEVA